MFPPEPESVPVVADFDEAELRVLRHAVSQLGKAISKARPSLAAKAKNDRALRLSSYLGSVFADMTRVSDAALVEIERELATNRTHPTTGPRGRRVGRS